MPGRSMLNELEDLDADVLRLAERVEDALAGATRALLDRDPGAAAQVIAGDDVLDELDNSLDERCHRILLLYQPVACDIRRVTAVGRMTADLERIGDLAVEIASQAATLAAWPRFTPPEGLTRMVAAAAELVSRAGDAYRRRDADLARSLCWASEEVIGRGADLTKRLIAAMRADPDAVEPGLCVAAVVQALRRVAGHASNLAENAVYLAEGRNIRHHWERPAPEGAANAQQARQ